MGNHLGMVGRTLAPIIFAGVLHAQADTSRPAVSLSAVQRAAIDRGQPVQVLEPVATSAWPRSTVYQFIEATPEESDAVLSDYELQSTYSPRVKSTRIVGRPSAVDTDVHYVIDVPIYPDEAYDMRQHLSCHGGEYDLSWRTLATPGTSGSVTEGSARFIGWTNGRSGRAGTLLVYTQLVMPSSVFARVPFVRSKGIEASRDAAHAIATQVEHERRDDRARLAVQLDRLRHALAASCAS